MDRTYDAIDYEGTDVTDDSWNRRHCQDRRAGRDRRKRDRRSDDEMAYQAAMPLSEAEIAALLNGSR